eukprot:GDKJ01010433.1.p5 GENE.GDKJ01010433.1~~GDKJ01010433.1.p5  ORF type:complete len:225 (+),score=-6.15 GDKJ01010433.1:1187-1861(+)
MKQILFLLKFLKFIYIKKRNSFNLMKFQIEWRLKNKHNFTSVSKIFPFESVKIGNKSYGELNVYSFSNGIDEELVIGNYVSIANKVIFILGGNHHINTLTSYPLKNFLLNIRYEDSFSKGRIVIEDEVWIGFGATILSGVKIGKGAIIAAGTVVTKDVAPYSIVGGNPQKLIRFRFEKDVIEELMKINLADFSDKFITDNIDKFYSEIKSKYDIISLSENKDLI